MTELRPLGATDIRVSPVALGTWPMAGMTSLETSERDSLETISAALDQGINFFDTAYSYGPHGESELMLGKALGKNRNRVVIATKAGIHWKPDGVRGFDAHPKTLRKHCEESLRRLKTDRVELFYLHVPDPNVPLAESAGALKRLMEEGKILSVGVSNFNLQQLEEFAAVCPITANQPFYNMLQRDIEADTLPWCQQHNVSVCIYWPLMKGLLAGKFARDHRFDPRDNRLQYPMFSGDEWQKNQDFLDQLRAIAAESEKTVAQIVINWTIHRPGITAALCGAKRPDQIRETAAAMNWKLDQAHVDRIDAAIARRGQPETEATGRWGRP